MYEPRIKRSGEPSTLVLLPRQRCIMSTVHDYLAQRMSPWWQAPQAGVL